MKQLIKDYFNFSRRERIAIIIILILLLAVFFLPVLTAGNSKTVRLDTDTALMSSIRQLENQKEEDKNDQQADNFYPFSEKTVYPDKKDPAGRNIPLFYFDPNTLPATGWKKLGLRDKTIQTIQNYLSKGGKFRKPEDLQKIYGLSKAEYERLLPYIQLEGITENKPVHEDVKKGIKPSSFDPIIIDINTADTTAWIALPGIGSKLSARIINFRDKLGGFYSVDQVKETYGLQDSVFQKIKPYLKASASSVKKININTVTLDELKQHPYFKYNIANPVILYRNEHGLFSKVEDIKKVMVITENVFNKVAPYIITQ